MCTRRGTFGEEIRDQRLEHWELQVGVLESKTKDQWLELSVPGEVQIMSGSDEWSGVFNWKEAWR